MNQRTRPKLDLVGSMAGEMSPPPEAINVPSIFVSKVSGLIFDTSCMESPG